MCLDPIIIYKISKISYNTELFLIYKSHPWPSKTLQSQKTTKTP